MDAIFEAAEHEHYRQLSGHFDPGSKGYFSKDPQSCISKTIYWINIFDIR